jgi:hypothetical protein
VVDRRGKLASRFVRRHKRAMRYLVPLAVLLVAGCAPTPAPQPAKPASPASTAPDQHEHRTVNGMTAGELIQHFGKPKLQIMEGQSTKLQFSGPSCVLDVYLYPPESGSGPARATFIEARNLQGTSISAQSCAAAIEGR